MATEIQSVATAGDAPSTSADRWSGLLIAAVVAVAVSVLGFVWFSIRRRSRRARHE